MNERFINIKIDREERPDLDHIYMDAVQAISGSGGWPLNVFLTPEKKPFYGGTYFPPEPFITGRRGRIYFLGYPMHSLTGDMRSIRKQKILPIYIFSTNQFGTKGGHDTDPVFYSEEEIDKIFLNILKTADTIHGGFGNAPKFPQTFIIRFLLLLLLF